ncbi:hypothetical protein Fmac_021600 [Flemingia macrophylla]|uniref:Uncharacterized protein n=1 Tax=Flemingia macrophylla TaxID=520843 RepID=A0ABD1LXX2_9FABA
MDAIVHVNAQLQPLLETTPGPPHKTPKTPTQRTVRKTFKGTAHLAKLLPTGTVLIFQTLSPLFTHQGECHTTTSKFATIGLLAFCSMSCILLSFTDSFRDERGKVRYGVVSPKGLWVVDASVGVPDDLMDKYRLRFIDFFHAFMSVLVFLAVALFDGSVVSCFVPKPSEETKELLMALPIGIGIVCSVLFVAFPSQRHGIGSPLSRN